MRRYGNLMAVMALGGLWHGAGWTFVLWGVLHGVYLAINHLWWAIVGSGDEHEGRRFGLTGRWLGRTITLFFVMLSWTLFRAGDMESAVKVYKGLFTLHGIVLPSHYQAVFGSWAEAISHVGISFGAVPTYGGGMQIVWLLVILAVVWFFPSTHALMHKYEPALDFDETRSPEIMGISIPAWRPSLMLGAFSGAIVLFLVTRMLGGQPGEFIYFQF